MDTETTHTETADEPRRMQTTVRFDRERGTLTLKLDDQGVETLLSVLPRDVVLELHRSALIRYLHGYLKPLLHDDITQHQVRVLRKTLREELVRQIGDFRRFRMPGEQAANAEMQQMLREIVTEFLAGEVRAAFDDAVKSFRRDELPKLRERFIALVHATVRQDWEHTFRAALREKMNQIVDHAVTHAFQSIRERRAAATVDETRTLS